VDVVLQGNRQPVHEGGSRCDGVAVKHIRLFLNGNLDALLCKLLSQPLLFLFLCQYTSLAIKLLKSCLVSSNFVQSSMCKLQVVCFTLCLLAAAAVALASACWASEQASHASSRNNSYLFLGILCCTKPPGTLLVHLCTWRNSICNTAKLKDRHQLLYRHRP